jgi:LysR family transcriptional regulator, glycine cleavage system transcriptional activator
MAVPLALLHTFVIVARSGRMREAAASMALTPGAVSQRVRALEEMLGRRLFSRTQAGVTLTAAGRTLFASLDEPFRRIEATGGETPGARSHRVTVSTMSSFAASWLVPRLSSFSRRHSEIDVSLEIESRVVDLSREPVDLAIRHGNGDYPGLVVAWLMAPALIVVASPALLKSRAPIRAAADCLGFPLLHDSDRADWRLWLETQAVKVPRGLKGPSFSDDHLMVKAAVAGQGLALVRDLYADDELRAGRLVRAIDVQWPTSFAYYVVCTKESLQKPAVRRFRKWLIEEADAGSSQVRRSALSPTVTRVRRGRTALKHQLG